MAQQIGRAGRHSNALVSIVIETEGNCRNSKDNVLFEDIFDKSIGSLVQQWQREQDCIWKSLTAAYSNAEIEVEDCVERGAARCSFCRTSQRQPLAADDNNNNNNTMISVETETVAVALLQTARETIAKLCKNIAMIVDGWLTQNERICLLHLDHAEGRCPLVFGRCFFCGSRDHGHYNCSVASAIFSFSGRVALHLRVSENKNRKQLTFYLTKQNSIMKNGCFLPNKIDQFSVCAAFERKECLQGCAKQLVRAMYVENDRTTLQCFVDWFENVLIKVKILFFQKIKNKK